MIATFWQCITFDEYICDNVTALLIRCHTMNGNHMKIDRIICRPTYVSTKWSVCVFLCACFVHCSLSESIIHTISGPINFEHLFQLTAIYLPQHFRGQKSNIIFHMQLSVTTQFCFTQFVEWIHCMRSRGN